MAGLTHLSRLSRRDVPVCPGGTGRRDIPGPPTGGPGNVPTVLPDLADRLVELARQVERLSPSHRKPEGFFEDRSEIAHELRQVARQVARG